MQNWVTYAIDEAHNLSTAGTVYDKPDNKYFKNYLEYVKKHTHEDVPERFIPLNPPPVPKIIDDSDPGFSKCFEDATQYILFAATACQRLRIDDEISRRSKLRWYSVLADLYDKYRNVINDIPDLCDSRDVEEAMNIAESLKRDKKKRNVLAKEVMAGRRINKILKALRGQWHVIDLHDNITREFLINNTQDFFDSLVGEIRWPAKIKSLPYKPLTGSGSEFQYTLVESSEISEISDENDDEEIVESSEISDENNDEETSQKTGKRKRSREESRSGKSPKKQKSPLSPLFKLAISADIGYNVSDGENIIIQEAEPKQDEKQETETNLIDL